MRSGAASDTINRSTAHDPTSDGKTLQDTAQLMDPGLHQWHQPVVPEGSRHENIEMFDVKN